ncbi:hypothetical protein MLD38_004615 [Melastoma candidum]|uniref:Uncharacterized protein n=1 Tax=Melastoma candidum TaxID=119954 RepID=A0ACB9S9J3_9MYRT|nr:hypothetical protein MLD38_004615 [Melastoma candidum]
MRLSAIFQTLILAALVVCCALWANGEDESKYFTWEITYGTISPLGKPQQGILINGQFPGPPMELITNDNVIVNVINKLDEPFLITWNGIQQRKNSWQDGVLGTNCPIPPGTNWTYKWQAKDQIGTYFYFPTIAMQRAAGGFGALNVAQRSVIPVPYPTPYGEFTFIVGDWYNTNHKDLRQRLDAGEVLPLPDGLLINGHPSGLTFKGETGKQYMFRVTNVGISTSINFRIQGHTMLLVEVEGSHNLQVEYESLDIHVGQSVAVLVTLNANPKDYYIVASSRFTEHTILNTTAILQYDKSNTPASLPWPSGPTYQIHWSMKQARTILLNLTANAARPNPQGSYHYKTINITTTIELSNTETTINGTLRYAVNGISYSDPGTPLKLADYFKIPGVFTLNSIGYSPPPAGTPAKLGVPVIGRNLHDFVEIVFQNEDKKKVQSWHLDGYSFYVVAYGHGTWSPADREKYNMNDAIYRHTVQVYPAGWSAILVSMDNKGMWNLRSGIWDREYLGQQLYVRVWDSQESLFLEYDIPQNALLCGKAKRR